MDADKALTQRRKEWLPRRPFVMALEFRLQPALLAGENDNCNPMHLTVTYHDGQTRRAKA
jgi:hypothetical protein